MKPREESGFALLLVVLMAAIVCLALYVEIPRVAFETQRQKEQLLIERGEQYRRAIKVFVSPAGAGRWPATLDELEDMNGRRFLRHRFIDPMTGKDDWRLIHIQNGIYTDSLIARPANPGDPNQKQGEPADGQDQAASQQSGPNSNPALRRRPSDNAPGDAFPGAPAADRDGQQPAPDGGASNPTAPPPANPTSGAPNAAAAGAGINGTPAPGGVLIGGGIAGIASTADCDSIMIYANRENYKEWEFIYDPRTDLLRNPVTGAVIQGGVIGFQAPAGLGTSAPGTAGPARR